MGTNKGWPSVYSSEVVIWNRHIPESMEGVYFKELVSVEACD